MAFASINRRNLLSLLASTAALAAIGGISARAEDNQGFEAIILSDLHSAYERLGQLLAVIEARVASSSLPRVVLINGDIFETGNGVAKRSQGEIDWAFLAALEKLGIPVVVNIGNHEPDFDNDLANFVSRAKGLGIDVISNIVDRRSGELFAPSFARFEIGGLPVRLAAIATDAINTYPKATRETLDIPEPVEWAKAHLADAFAGEGVNILLTHAGVVPDREILPLVPDGALVVGGHDHLTLAHSQGETRYVHTGSWASVVTIARIRDAGKAAEIETVTIERDAPSSDTLKGLIETVLAAHLTEEERAIVARTASALTLGETARFAAGAIAEKAGADIGFIGHTSFGTGLPAGDVSRHDYNSALRFDGKLMVAEVDAAGLAAILERANQDGDIALDRRNGDFLYSAPAAPAGKERYRIACNDWSAINQKSYFGRDDLAFSEVPDVKLKQVVLDALNR